MNEDINLPIPDEPRNRKTNGCSSSYHPFSFLRTAVKHKYAQTTVDKQAAIVFMN